MKKPSESVPDTNAIIRYLVKDDIALYNRAEKYFTRVKHGEERAIILESVIAECIYVLMKVYKVPKQKSAYSLIEILHYRGIANSDRKELIAALTCFSEKNIDIVDCIICAKAKNSRAAIFSFDNALIDYCG